MSGTSFFGGVLLTIAVGLSSHGLWSHNVDETLASLLPWLIGIGCTISAVNKE